MGHLGHGLCVGNSVQVPMCLAMVCGVEVRGWGWGCFCKVEGTSWESRSCISCLCHQSLPLPPAQCAPWSLSRARKCPESRFLAAPGPLLPYPKMKHGPAAMCLSPWWLAPAAVLFHCSPWETLLGYPFLLLWWGIP